MFDNLGVRNKFLATAAIPVNALVVVAVWAGAVAGEPILAAVAAAGAIATLIVAHRMGAALSRRLTSGADALAAVAGDDATKPSTDIAEPGNDEVGRLLRVLDETTIRLETERAEALVASDRKTSTMLESLSARTHSLLDEQLGHIDWLEATEEDPDRLQHLFELDHLATRMRRSAESLIVMAGTDSIHNRSEPAPVADMIRVAMSENTHYRRIELQAVDEVFIQPTAACEMTHLLSELLENATRFSPDGSPVELFATLLDDGSYRVTIIDRGEGMSEKQLAATNAFFADPTDLGLDLDLGPNDSIGLRVISRLASHVGARVTLSPTAVSGVTAEVVLPAELVANDELPAPQLGRTIAGTAPPEQGKVGEWTAPEVDRSPVPVLVHSDPVTAVTAGVAPSQTKKEDAPGREQDVAVGAVGVISADREPEVATGWRQPDIAGRAVADELGLTRRVRSASTKAADGRLPATASRRKPDEVRSMITKYRDGLKGSQPSSE